MKRIISLSFLVFFVSGNINAQYHAVNLVSAEKIFRDFWKLARSNKVKSAKKKFFANISYQDSENKDRQLRDSFQIVSQNKLEFPKLDTSQTSIKDAFFTFQIESKNKKKFKGQALLLNENGSWKVFVFDVNPVTETTILTPAMLFSLTFGESECPACS